MKIYYRKFFLFAYRNFILGLIILLTQFNCIKAQNVAFTQYTLSPAQTNPALIATSNQTRFILNYRNQFIQSGQSYTTPMFSVIHPWIRKQTEKRIAAFGVSFMQDKTGEGGILTTTGGLLTSAVNLSLSSKKPIWLSMGVQGGFFQRGVNVLALTSGSQWDGSVFNPGLALDDFTNIQEQNINKTFPIFNAGALFYISDTCDNVKAFLGVDLKNINQPNVSFFNDSQDKLPIHLSIIGGVNLNVNNRFGIQPNVRWVRQGNQQSIRTGAMFNYQFFEGQGVVKDGNLSLGAWYDLNSNLAISMEVHQPQYFIGFSYDLGASSPINALGASAWELSVGIKLGKKCRDKPQVEPIPDMDTTYLEKKIYDISKNYVGDSLYTMVASILKGEVLKVDTIKASFKPNELNLEWLIPTDEDLKILKKQVFFYYISADLNNTSKSILDNVAAMMLKFRGVEVEIMGHTCNIGDTEETNQILSINRAKTVQNYLISKGIEERRLKISGFGSSKPVLTNTSEYGRIKNRRVEFKLLNKGEKR